MRELSPIALFAYNRPRHTRQTVEALSRNILAPESELFVFSDGAKNDAAVDLVKETRDYLSAIRGFKKVTIIERDKNYGLGKNIIAGVTEIINQFGRIIVLEDDLITSPYFLQFMNEALELHQPNTKVLSIHGYMYPVKKPVPDNFFLIDP